MRTIKRVKLQDIDPEDIIRTQDEATIEKINESHYSLFRAYAQETAFRQALSFGQQLTRAFVSLFVLGAILTLTACSREPGETPHEPGSFLRPGGDVVTPR